MIVCKYQAHIILVTYNGVNPCTKTYRITEDVASQKWRQFANLLPFLSSNPISQVLTQVGQVKTLMKRQAELVTARQNESMPAYVLCVLHTSGFLPTSVCCVSAHNAVVVFSVEK